MRSRTTGYGGRDRTAHSGYRKSPHVVALERGAKRANKMLYSGQNPLSARFHRACRNRTRPHPARRGRFTLGDSGSSTVGITWNVACDRSTKMARGTKSPLKEGRQKIRFLISNSLAVGALRTHDTLLHLGAGTRHPGGIRCGTCRPGIPIANSTTAN